MENLPYIKYVNPSSHWFKMFPSATYFLIFEQTTYMTVLSMCMSIYFFCIPLPHIINFSLYFPLFYGFITCSQLFNSYLEFILIYDLRWDPGFILLLIGNPFLFVFWIHLKITLYYIFHCSVVYFIIYLFLLPVTICFRLFFLASLV